MRTRTRRSRQLWRSSRNRTRWPRRTRVQRWSGSPGSRAWHWSRRSVSRTSAHWYQLPVKWLIGIDGKLRVADGLARVLDLLQLPRHAAICRSQTTREILNAYQIGTAEGKAAFRRAAAASGIMPPGLPGIALGAGMGFRRDPPGGPPPAVPGLRSP